MPLPITVVSDIVCPWCFIGHRRLGDALTRLPDLETAVDWRPYQLHPYIPREGVSFDEHYRRKFGGNVDALRDRMQQAGQSAGIDFHFDLIERVPNTLAAHTVIDWAPPGETRNALVDRSDVVERLARDDDRERIAAEADATRRGGITGVPFFLIGDRYPIVGAQSPETMVQVIERVLNSQG